MKPVEVRSQLVDALRLDLVGPDNGSDLEAEILPQGSLALVSERVPRAHGGRRSRPANSSSTTKTKRTRN